MQLKNFFAENWERVFGTRIKTASVALSGTAIFFPAISLLVLWFVLGIPASSATASGTSTSETTLTSIVLPEINVQRGRRLFVHKGCVLCHSINGVGGDAAPSLDAERDVTFVNVLDFVARMWRGAWAMLELQTVELGYQIEFTSDEIADLAGFAMDAGAQADFSIDEVPKPMRRWMMDEPYWESGEWPPYETFEW
jgi:mono/diheme cytochrome c family protein